MAARKKTRQPGMTSAITGAGIRVMLYAHDTLGLGHIHRSLRIAQALRDRYPEMSILQITGSPQAYRYRYPPRVDYVKLPSVFKVGDDRYDPRYLNMPFQSILELRTSIILETAKRYRPHMLLVDHKPLGMKEELLPTLRWLQACDNPPFTVLGMRDILDEPGAVKKIWTEKGIYRAFSDFYDHIAIYGCPDIFDPVSSYDFPPDVRSKTSFCGYISDGDSEERAIQHREMSHRNDRKLVLVTTAGGDGAGELIIGNYLDALRSYRSDIPFDSLIVTGPFIPDELWNRFKRESRHLPVRLLKYVSGMSAFINRSDLVVSTAGYNSLTDILAFARRALLIPRTVFREYKHDEQLIRAERFSSLGLVSFMHPDRVRPGLLLETVESMLAGKDSPLDKARIEKMIPLDGRQRLMDFLTERLATIRHDMETGPQS